MKTVRLENASFGLSSARIDEVNKVVEFDSENGALNVHVLESPRLISFNSPAENELVKEILSGNLDQSQIRIIHNLPVSDAYSAPFKIYLDITLNCLSSCPFCLAGVKPGMAVDLPTDTIRQVAKEAHELGVLYIKVGGGDPSLHPDFFEIISILRSEGLFVTLSTNSTNLNPLMARFLAMNKVRISVSIEGMERVDDSLRGAGHFHKAMAALEMLKEAGADVVFRTTLLRQNLNDIPGLVKLAKSRAVKIKFSYCRSAGRAITSQAMLSDADYPGYLKALEFLNSPEILPHVLMDEGMMFQQPTEISNKLYLGRMCGAANRSMHINALGKISPCVFLGSDFSFGKIYEDGSIIDFWRGNVGNKFKDVRKIQQPHECDNCDRLCKNECPANRLYFHGNFFEQDPNCLNEVRRKMEKNSFKLTKGVTDETS